MSRGLHAGSVNGSIHPENEFTTRRLGSPDSMNGQHTHEAADAYDQNGWHVGRNSQDEEAARDPT